MNDTLNYINYISVTEAARILDISPATVRKKCLAGELLYYQQHKNATIFVSVSNFKTDKKTWDTFINKRCELYERSRHVAELAILVLEEDL